MSSTLKIGYIVGSLSKNSINRRLANAFVKLAPENIEFVEIEIKDLPLYNHDLDVDYPETAKKLKADIEAVDGVVIFSPEYNRGVPAALKNAIEFASRPWGTNSFEKKPVIVAGTSGGGIASAIAQQQLRAIFLHLNAYVMGQPELYIQTTEGLIDDNYEVTNEGTKEFFTSVISSIEDWVTQHAAVRV